MQDIPLRRQLSSQVTAPSRTKAWRTYIAADSSANYQTATNVLDD